MQELSNHGWSNIHGIPYYFFYYYAPTRFKDLISPESRDIQKLIWEFKDGYNSQHVANLVCSKILAEANTLNKFNNLTFVCIPASTNQSHRNRFKNFSSLVCGKLNLYNGYDHIVFEKEGTPSHLGGNDKPVFMFDRSFFEGKNVILFDDVVTRGNNMSDFIYKMRNAGASVVACMSIGRTTLQQMLNEAHPYNHHNIQGNFAELDDSGIINQSLNSYIKFNQGRKIDTEATGVVRDLKHYEYDVPF